MSNAVRALLFDPRSLEQLLSATEPVTAGILWAA